TVHVCICQPEPKIPRPRNSFMLYRQHNQARFIDKHPGIANPEVSKILGELWKSEPASVKEKWKLLAEEEKLRHREKYPEYRYQPRRSGGRRRSTSDTYTTTLCDKCGG
ncbi:high mobility group box domain-containing protein, partial [Cryomyces antarcticus]